MKKLLALLLLPFTAFAGDVLFPENIDIPPYAVEIKRAKRPDSAVAIKRAKRPDSAVAIKRAKRPDSAVEIKGAKQPQRLVKIMREAGLDALPYFTGFDVYSPLGIRWQKIVKDPTSASREELLEVMTRIARARERAPAPQSGE